MFDSLKRIFRRTPRYEAQLREEEEARVRGREESRAAEMRKSDDQRGTEGFGQRYLGPP
jgi:hypothetical protein